MKSLILMSMLGVGTGTFDIFHMDCPKVSITLIRIALV